MCIKNPRIAKNPTDLPGVLAEMTDKQPHVFILIADLPVIVAMSKKDAENAGKIAKSKLVYGLEMNLECVIIFRR